MEKHRNELTGKMLEILMEYSVTLVKQERTEELIAALFLIFQLLEKS